MSKKVLVIGSINMDVAISTERRPRVGETVRGFGFMTNPGGSGANQATTVAKMGKEAWMLGCVGNDAYGKELLSVLTGNGVKIDHIEKVDGVSTGVSVIITDTKGGKSIVIDGGANKYVSVELIKRSEDLIAQSDIVLLELEIPFDTVRFAAQLAKKHAKTVILNPKPPEKLDDTFLKNIDIIVPNDLSCGPICDMEITSIEDYKKASEYLYSKGVKHVIVNLGEKGALYYNGAEHKNILAPQVDPVDTTAAGDAFIGALTSMLSAGKSVEDAVEFANIVRAITVTLRGAQKSIPSLAQVKDFCDKKGIRKEYIN